MKRPVLILTVMLSAILSLAQLPTRAPIGRGPGSFDAFAEGPCLFDLQRGEVPNCIFVSVSGRLLVEKKYLKELTFDSFGLAAVLSLQHGWMYLNRKGQVLITGVPPMDNGPDPFHDGLVRVVEYKKYGFANRSGRIVIPAIYDGAMAFENGRAEVCIGCEEKCAEAECQHHFFAGGRRIWIDTKGSVIR
jgi:hypothetical protein